MLLRAWRFCGWCTLQGSRALLFSVWLLLLAALAVQAWLLHSRNLPVPEPLRRLVTARASANGIRLDYGSGRMDFAGHLLLESVSIEADACPGLRASARSAYLRFNPWLLVVGVAELREVKINGLALRFPGDDGAAPLRDVDLAFTLDADHARVPALVGRLGGMPVVLDADFRLPSSSAAEPRSAPVVDAEAVRRLGAEIRRGLALLESVDAPRLGVSIRRPGPRGLLVSLDVAADSARLPETLSPDAGRLRGIRAGAELAFSGDRLSGARVSGRIGSAELPGGVTARDLVFDFEGTADAPTQSLRVQLGEVRRGTVVAGPLAVEAVRPAADRVAAVVSAGLAGSPWALRGEADLSARFGRLEIEGFVDDAALAFVGPLIGKDLGELLDPAQAAPLHAVARFDPGWKLRGVSGRLHSGFVRVGTVNLDETGTEFTYDGEAVFCDNLVLRQGDSLALGSYSMDTHTMDFRFLLAGTLRPEGISGWFHSWWSNFWTMFAFSGPPPAAEVDVQGRWGDVTATRVFVAATGENTGLKGVPFDRVSTRLFLRPHWFDIRRFAVARGAASAEGSLARSLDAGDAWRHMEFSVESTLPLDTIAALFPSESAGLLDPYRFSSPPRLTLQGRVDSAASPAGKHERIDVGVASSGPMTYHGFPLSDLSVKALIRDDDVDIPALSAGFAGGKASGRAALRNPAADRRLSFDINLAGAGLGAVIDAVSSLRPPEHSKPPSPKAAEEARQLRERLAQNTLYFSLAAEGPYADFLAFRGAGRAEIRGAGLGQLNLFGPLSRALGGTFINLGSFSLDTVETGFDLNGDRLSFPDLRVSGPSALIQARGDYLLRGGGLDFSAKVRPFRESDSVVGSAVDFVLTPLSSVFEVRLKGTLGEPSWIFNYGPSHLLETITGPEKPASAKSVPTSSARP